MLNDIIFGLQDWARNTPNSRAFTTDTLINFDVHDGTIERDTLIHETCHVWQSLVTGPFYMVEAIHALMTNANYNYGYTNEENGDGAEDALQAKNGDFDQFDPEQQAQIAMHYWVRRIRESRPAADYADWQTYVDVIQAGAVPA